MTKNTEQFIGKLELSPDLKTAILLAAKFHDLGKRRLLWQRSIGNPDPNSWLAKSGGKMRLVELTKYRHEFGSLFDARKEPEFLTLNAEMQDLVLHLIAAHHGRARPHFPVEEAFDLNALEERSGELAIEVAQRFTRLQCKYGRWGLAYLESLLRAADYAASANPSACALDRSEGQT